LILIIQTTYSAHGGIPTYNRTVCRALAQGNNIADEIEKRLLLVTDRPVDVSKAAASLPGLRIEAFSGNRVAFVRRVFALALTRRIDLLLVGHVNYALLGVMLKRFQPRMRFGVVTYGIDVWEKLRIAKRYALGVADFVVTISEYTKQCLVRENGVTSNSIRLAPPCLEDLISWSTHPIETSSNSNKGAAQLTLLSVCRLDKSERYKGVDNVIEALPTVLNQYPQVQYFVVGSGSDLDRHKKLADEKCVTDSVHFVGSVDAASLQDYYQKCDVFVMCSAREGFGIVYLEAMRYGKPVIAANSCGAPEVVKDRETGLLIEYGDVNQLASAITELCSDGGLRKKLGDAGRERLKKHYTFAHFRQRLHDIILAELPPHVVNHEQRRVGLADGTL
jgi:phosphatidyl-myo-inositol dimannoside synthase